MKSLETVGKYMEDANRERRRIKEKTKEVYDREG